MNREYSLYLAWTTGPADHGITQTYRKFIHANGIYAAALDFIKQAPFPDQPDARMFLLIEPLGRKPRKELHHEQPKNVPPPDPLDPPQMGTANHPHHSRRHIHQASNLERTPRLLQRLEPTPPREARRPHLHRNRSSAAQDAASEVKKGDRPSNTIKQR